MTGGLALVCPACRASLPPADPTGTACAVCGRGYPVVAGVLDLRLTSDRYLTLEEDRAKAVALDALGLGYGDTVRAYWARTPEVPPDLAARYTDRALEHVGRAAGHLRELGGVEPGDLFVDVGCGTGGLVVAAAGTGARAVGVDLALRWLVLARRAAEECGVAATFLAADGAHLPFASGTVDTVCSIEALEHTEDRAAFVAGCLDAVGRSGRLYLVTANRTSLAREPTVGLWGIGLLPRRLATAYVARRRHTRYQWFAPVTVRRLRAWAAAASRTRATPAVGVGAARLPEPVVPPIGVARVLRRAYAGARASRVGAAGLRWIAPYLELRAPPPPRAVSRGRARSAHPARRRPLRSHRRG